MEEPRVIRTSRQRLQNLHEKEKQHWAEPPASVGQQEDVIWFRVGNSLFRDLSWCSKGRREASRQRKQDLGKSRALISYLTDGRR